jgi:methylglutaconyl-CoA hydratase/polyketide biosynthesis enoyl-CoA hydratase PksH
MSNRVSRVADGALSRITLSSPGSGNALGTAMLEELADAIAWATSSPCSRVIALAAEGPDFCTGMDLEAAFGGGRRPDDAGSRRFAECLLRLCESDQPVIAAASGRVSGGGVGLLSACDLVIAGRDAVFSLPEVVLGLVPALITPFLCRRLPLQAVRRLTLGSSAASAADALRMGLVDEVAEADPQRALDAQVRRLLRSSPQALAECKRDLNARGGDLRRQVEDAVARSAAWLARPDVAEGISAFLGGERPAWFEARARAGDGAG